VNVITPVATTDYLVNSATDGTGTDLTGSCTVTVDVFSTGAKISIENTSGSIGYITLLKVRGDAIIAQANVRVLAEDTASQSKYGVRTFDLDGPWVQNTNAARSFANYLKTFLSIERPYFEFEIVGRPDVQFALALGQQIRLYLPDEDVDVNVRVHYLRHQSMDRALMAWRTTVMVEPFEQLTDEYWYVPHTIPMRVAY
jgi:hypothetical protein